MNAEILPRRGNPVMGRVVQVRIAGATAKRTYAYEVPEGISLSVGDWVTIPGNVVSEFGGFGIVKSYGRDGYRGPLKTIKAKIPEPPEIMVRMSVVKTREQAADLYDRAEADGWSADRLTALAVIGQSRLKARGVR